MCQDQMAAHSLFFLPFSRDLSFSEMKFLLLFLIPLILAFDVDLYDHTDHHHVGSGSHVRMSIRHQCTNLPHHFQHKASSVNTHGHCVKLCSRENCHGDCVTVIFTVRLFKNVYFQLRLIGGCHPTNNLANCGFNDRAASIQQC